MKPDCLQIGLALLLLCGPGWLWPLPRRLSGRAICLRLVIGLAATIIVLYPSMLWGGRSAFFVAAIAGAAGWLGLLRGLRKRRPRLVWHWHGGDFAVAATVITSSAWALSRSPYPRGFDAVFHTLLARKISISGALSTDWLPFEPVSLNYPQGLHLLLSTLSTLTGVAEHLVFQWCGFWLGLLLAWIFYWLARAVIGRAGAGWAVLIMSACCQYGSLLSLWNWGGLPTLVDQLFIFAFLLLLTRRRRRCDAWAGGALLAAIVMVHHLSSLIAIAVFGVILVLGSVRRRRFMLCAVAAQLLLAAPYLGHYLPRAAEIGATDALRFAEEPAFTWLSTAQAMGVWLLPLVVVGLGWWHRRPQLVRHPKLLGCWALTLATIFLLLDRGYRTIVQLAYHLDYSALTPSRWLTALAYPLAIIAAAGVAAARDGGCRRRRLVSGIVICLTAAGLRQNLAPHLQPPPVRAEIAAAYLWAQQETPPDAVIVNLIPVIGHEVWWQSYLTWREASLSPLPASEPRNDPHLRHKQDVFGAYDLDALAAWLQAHGKLGFFLAPAGQFANALPPQLTPAASSESLILLRLRSQP